MRGRGGTVMINDVNLLATLQGVRNISNNGDGFNVLTISDDLSRIRDVIYNQGGLIPRIMRLENV